MRWIFEQMINMFFPLLTSFFLAGKFYFCSWGNFFALYLMSIVLIMIIDLLPSFGFSWFSLKCIQIVIFKSVCSFWIFLTFYPLAFDGFLFKDALFFRLSRFPCLLLTSVELYIWLLVWLYSSFRVCLSDVCCWESDFFHKVIACWYVNIDKWRPVMSRNFKSLFLISP